MSIPPGAAGVVIARRVPASHPQYQIVRANIFRYPVDAIVVPTDRETIEDEDAPQLPDNQPLSHEWRRLGNGFPAPPPRAPGAPYVYIAPPTLAMPSGGLLDAYNRAWFFPPRLGPNPHALLAGRAETTISGALVNCNKIVMVNAPPFGTRISRRTPGNHAAIRAARIAALQAAYTAALDAALNPFVPPGSGITPAIALAFPLIGSGRLGYSADDAAQAAIDAVVAWYAPPGGGGNPAGLAQITDIIFIVPEGRAGNTIRSAWLRHWRRAIGPLALSLVPAVVAVAAPPIAPPRAPKIRNRELRDLQARNQVWGA